MNDVVYKMLNDELKAIIGDPSRDLGTSSMTALIISDINSTASVAGVRKLLKSVKLTNSLISPYILPATTPSNLSETMLAFEKSMADWKYPITPGEKKIDFASGLHLTGYGAKDIRKVVSCLFSHIRCWNRAQKWDIPILVLEHDAIFTRAFAISPEEVLSQGHDFVGLNDPRGATRKAHVFLDRVISQSKINQTFYDCPWVDDDKLAPQGLAGHSAYIITPRGANRMFKKMNEVGLWPNDALMCKQFFPDLKVTYPFYTKVQGTKSTTQG